MSVRMHTVSPASGVVSTPGSRQSDRELMQHVIREHDLKRMLQTTAHRPSGMGGGPVALPAAMVKALRRLGRPGRVPSVKQLIRRGMPVRGLPGDPAVELEVLGLGPERLQANGWELVNDCTPPGPRTFFRQASNVGTGPPGSFWQCFVNQYQEFQPEYPSPVPADHNALHILARQSDNPLQTDFLRYATESSWFREVTGTTDVPVMARTAMMQAPELKATPRARRRVVMPSNRQLQRRMPAYRRPAIEIEVRPDRNGEIAPPSPPTRTTHRDVPAKRQKKAIVGGKLGQALLGAYHKGTEINDFFEALADAIPGRPCSHLPGFQRAMCVIEHSGEIDPVQAGINLVANEIEDRLVAKAQGQLGKLTKAGGPNTTQINQWQRTLQGLLR